MWSMRNKMYTTFKFHVLHPNTISYHSAFTYCNVQTTGTNIVNHTEGTHNPHTYLTSIQNRSAQDLITIVQAPHPIHATVGPASLGPQPGTCQLLLKYTESSTPVHQQPIFMLENKAHVFKKLISKGTDHYRERELQYPHKQYVLAVH